MKSYTELEVWIESRKLMNEVYSLIKIFFNIENFGITSQIRRSAVSIPSNIAEGCGRRGSKEKKHFLYISRGSLYELETQLIISEDLEYVTNKDLKSTLLKIETCKKLLNGFINYYKKL